MIKFHIFIIFLNIILHIRTQKVEKNLIGLSKKDLKEFTNY